jgi:hypothetical protein
LPKEAKDVAATLGCQAPTVPGSRMRMSRMVIGADQFRTRRASWFDRLLLQPLCADTGSYFINRR